jgi:membrane protease YdiL (CAAX protease family)
MPRRRQPEPVDYLARTRELPVNLLFLVPWMALYPLCLLASRAPVENAAGAWVRDLAGTLGRDGLIAAGLLLCGLLCMVVLVRIKEAPRDRGLYGGMLLEGLVYGAALGLVAKVLAGHFALGRMVPLAIGEGLEGLRRTVEQLGLALGAGVFEELVFRGLLLLGIYALLQHGLGTDRFTAGLLAILVSAWAFSGYHHWGVGGEPYDPGVFAFRFWAGAVLGAIFLTRGLGIAALAHGFYDVLVLVGR